MSKLGKAGLLLGAAAIAAGVLLKRDKVAGLLASRSQSGARDTGWAPAPAPAPSNYDAPGPVANTATPVPAPEPQVRPGEGGVDERAEEAAAAAEAANIGGPVSDYPAIDEPSLAAGEADRPLVESGEGSAEGGEQAEAALAAAAEPVAPGVSDYERQIDDTIEQASQPSAGEQAEPVKPLAEPEPAGTTEPLGSEPVAATPEPEPVAATPEPEPVAVTPEPEPVAVTPEPEPVAVTPEPEPAAPALETPGVPATDPATEPVTGDAGAEAPVTPASTSWQPPAPEAPAPPVPPSEQPTAEQPLPERDAEEDDSNDWKTWSGRAINP